MRHAFMVVLMATLILSGFDRSQVNYKKRTPVNRWVFDYTGNEMLWWTLARAMLIVLGG